VLSSLGTIAEHNSRLAPDLEAVVDGKRRLTWREVHERTARLADALASRLGCRPGDRVAFLGENCLEGYELFHATARAAVLLVPLNDRLAPAELRAILDVVEPRVLFHTAAYAEVAAELGGPRVATVGIRAEYDGLLARGTVTAARSPCEVSSICFTSGTTGRPKGVQMTHVAQFEFARVEALLEPVEAGARHLFARPMAVAPGHRMIAWHGVPPATTVIMPRFDPDEFFRFVAAERITNVLVAPTMLRMLLDNGNPHGHDLSSLRSMTYGGAPMTAQLLREVLDFFPCSLMQGYGGSEAGQVLVLTGEDHRAGRIETNGRPVPGVEVEIRAPGGHPVVRGEVGELHVRTRQLMSGYWRDPQGTTRVLADGWYATGDLAEERRDGYVAVVGRVSDMIISGGFNVMPLEVEQVIATHPAVLDVAVYAAPDPLWGEAVHAAVVVRAGAAVSADELIALCRDRLASFKKPQRVEFVDELPRTGIGKIDKRALRERSALRS
jgi:acyl-CoA synthetase (AMP-forming)/AMP-acid ligase II